MNNGEALEGPIHDLRWKSLFLKSMYKMVYLCTLNDSIEFEC